MTIVTTIQHTARQQLGRPAHRTGRFLDWDAIRAVQDAARQHGLTEPVERWIAGGSLTALASQFVSRYQQAYGVGVGATAGYVDPTAEWQARRSLATVVA